MYKSRHNLKKTSLRRYLLVPNVLLLSILLFQPLNPVFADEEVEVEIPVIEVEEVSEPVVEEPEIVEDIPEEPVVVEILEEDNVIEEVLNDVVVEEENLNDEIIEVVEGVSVEEGSVDVVEENDDDESIIFDDSEIVISTEETESSTEDIEEEVVVSDASSVFEGEETEGVEDTQNASTTETVFIDEVELEILGEATTTEETVADSSSVDGGGGTNDIETSDTSTASSTQETIENIVGNEIASSTEDVVDDTEEVEELTSPVVIDSEEVLEDISVIEDFQNNSGSDNQEEENLAIDVAVHTVFNDENKYGFSANECISVGDGSFYCTESQGEAVTLETDRIFAATDTDGDREIYIERNGDIIQITDNLIDDDAPFYDEASETVVWHRKVDGRYQIIEYDLISKKEKQLTSERYNNMQPSRYGELIVWQGWVGNDWEIMLEDDGELLMITDNNHHDISPSINGDYVVWQSFEDESWRVKVYDRRTGVTDTISDTGGGSVENPRFVLVYDTKLDNGDVETKGYDLRSGDVVPLSSTPAPVPKDIPDPEQTGEDRALVTPIVQIKTKTENGDDVDLDIGSSTDNGVLPLAEDDIVITSYISDTSTEQISTDEMTIKIENILTTTENNKISELEEISDVVVTPFVEEILEIPDSQEEVASST